MENKNNKLKIQKIPLFALIKILDKLYDEGVEYIDICGEISGERDLIKIGVREDYMKLDEEDDQNEEYEEEFDEEDLNKKSSTIEVKKLTDEDLTNLL